MKKPEGLTEWREQMMDVFHALRKGDDVPAVDKLIRIYSASIRSAAVQSRDAIARVDKPKLAPIPFLK